MRITFALAAILAATVCATPLAPANTLSSSASTLTQIDAQLLDSAPITTEAADNLWMGQTELDLDTLAEDGEPGKKQMALAKCVYKLYIALRADRTCEVKDDENREIFEEAFAELTAQINKMNGSGAGVAMLKAVHLKKDKYKIDGSVADYFKEKFDDAGDDSG